jgi:septal ring factor EnvC (AmiA/AmiB activator)
MGFEKASVMTDPSMVPEAPDVAETASFLRRFAGLMANGYNATYLHRAAELLETLTVRVTASSDEEKLWRYKYESLSEHADALEAECDALKHDIDGHLSITSSVLAERDKLKEALQAREAELSELGGALGRERGELAAKSAAHDGALAELRAAFDHERGALKAALETRGGQVDQLRHALERERAEFQAQLKEREDELAALRVVSERENGELKAQVMALEAKRAELRSAVDRIGYLRNQTAEHQDSAEGTMPARPETAANLIAAHPGDRDSAIGETNAVVPKTTLRQARAQFEYLAKEFVPLGDIASQVMCELGAYTMDLALISGQRADHLPIREVARSILAPSRAKSVATADPM